MGNYLPGEVLSSYAIFQPKVYQNPLDFFYTTQTLAVLGLPHNTRMLRDYHMTCLFLVHTIISNNLDHML
jgi:hypothetical protein